jgi:hypothetical protein
LSGICWNEPFEDRGSAGSIGSIERVLESTTGERRRLFLFQILYSAERNKRYERTPGWRLMVKRMLEWRWELIYFLRRKYCIWRELYRVLLPAMLYMWLHQGWCSSSECTCNG